MPAQPLTIWTNVKYPADAMAALTTGISPHRLVFAAKTEESNLVTAPDDPALSTADVAFGQPKPDQLLTASNLKWLHLNTAGYNAYDRADLRDIFAKRDAQLTNSSTVYANPCAQHLLAMMLALGRQLPQSIAAQQRNEWQWKELRFNCSTLTGQTILIVGFGAIARRLVELLAPFGCTILAVRRTPRGDESVKTYPQSDLARLLPEADHVINILPGNLENEEYFNADLLGKMKRDSAFYNIGRGSTVDTYAPCACLETNHLSAAYLDVTMAEPLPHDDPLWTTPHCHITPHIAGGQQDEYIVLVNHFLQNLRRFESSKPLLDQVY